MRRPYLVLYSIIFLALASTLFAQDDSPDKSAEASDSEIPAAYDSYIIQSGDTLFVIARRFNIAVEDLKAANSIVDGARILEGQILLIPTGEDSSVDVYEVQAGDTLYSISKEYNTSIGILRALNELGAASVIVTGQTILVPSIKETEASDASEASDDSDYEVYVVKAGDSLFSIAKRFNIVVSLLKGLNGIADERELQAGQSILVPKIDHNQYEVYQVQPADSLYTIARRFATNEETLLALNGISDERDIEAGQTMLVPRIDDSRYTVHVVQHGDTLFDLARLFNTTVAQLRRLNGIEGRTDLTVGRSIIAPRVDETILERYIVQTGDSLYGIAGRYGVDLTVLLALNRLADARDLQAGQPILLPKVEGVSLVFHVIQLGDTLEKLARRYETTVKLLQSLNGIADPSLIVLGEAILVPEPAEIQVRPGFGFGLQVFTERSRAADLADMVNQLGAGWVKIDVRWAEIETAPNIYSYAALDSMIAAMELAGLKIMLNVYDAPAWSRKTYTETLNSQFRDYAGPPEDYDDFARFLSNLVIRYAGLVDAYEIWKSPNLVKFWTAPVYTQPQVMTEDGEYGIPDEIQMGARYYVPLLETAYKTIKTHDARALVVTAGLAPAGFHDNYNSIDTGVFLKNMLREGAADFSDAIGAIFSASAAPPTLDCCDKPPGVDTHYESFLQYFGSLLAFYNETLRGQEVDLPIFVTQMGWGTADGANLAVPSTGFEWLNYTSEAEQALYITQAYQIAQSLEYVAAIFLYNLNGCAVGDEEACFFSMEDAESQMRPCLPLINPSPSPRIRVSRSFKQTPAAGSRSPRCLR